MTRAIQKCYAEWIQHQIIHPSWKSWWFPWRSLPTYPWFVGEKHPLLLCTILPVLLIYLLQRPTSGKVNSHEFRLDPTVVVSSKCVLVWHGYIFQPCLIVQRSLVTNCKQRASLGPSKCEPVQRWSQVVTGKMHPTFRSVRWIGFSTNIYLRNPSWNAGKHALVMYLCPQTIAFFLINVSISIGLYSQNVFVLPLLPLLHG